MHDILYQGWHLVHNIAVRKAQEQLPGVRFVEFTHSLPLLRPEKMVYPPSARFTGMPNTRFAYPTRCGLPALARQYDIPESACAVVNNTLVGRPGCADCGQLDGSLGKGDPHRLSRTAHPSQAL